MSENSVSINQPCVWELAKFLSDKSEISNIIYVTLGVTHNLDIFDGEYTLTVFSLKDNESIYLKKCSSFISLDVDNLDFTDFKSIFDNSIVIINNFVENIKNKANFFTSLNIIQKYASYVLLTTPDRLRCDDLNKHNKHEKYTIEEFHNILKENNISTELIGYTYNNSFQRKKNFLLAIFGKETIPDINIPKVSVLAIISTFNEEDMILETINHLLNQGIDVHVIDNWSTDKTYEKIEEKFSNNNRVTLSKFPDKKENASKFDWGKILKHKQEIAKKSGYDWIIQHDADEIRYPPWNIPLIDAISYVDYLGYTAIDSTEIIFRFTEKSQYPYDTYEQNLIDYHFGRRAGHFLRVNFMKNNEHIDLVSSLGHSTEFPSKKVYPFKFLLKHYPLRSKEHSITKIFKERLPRFNKKEYNNGAHRHYDAYVKENIMLWKEYDLKHWNEYFFNQEYLIERISGGGVIKDPKFQLLIPSSELKENQKLKQKIKEMKKSNSWKITKPLRKIGQMLKKLKK